jgi:hypothetical protein
VVQLAGGAVWTAVLLLLLLLLQAVCVVQQQSKVCEAARHAHLTACVL